MNSVFRENRAKQDKLWTSLYLHVLIWFMNADIQRKLHRFLLYNLNMKRLCCCFRDFAYVARDKNTRVLKCHVFQCESPAETVASSLKQICSKVRETRSHRGIIHIHSANARIQTDKSNHCSQIYYLPHEYLWGKSLSNQSSVPFRLKPFLCCSVER